MRHDDFWFTTSRVKVRLSNRENPGGISLLEHILPYDFSPPMHVHYDEDETFYVIEGDFLFEMDGAQRIVGTGDVVYVPAGARHSFLVTSPGGGRFLTITQGGFEDMVRQASRPTTTDSLPPQVHPSLAQQEALVSAGLRNGIALLGAPLAA